MRYSSASGGVSVPKCLICHLLVVFSGEYFRRGLYINKALDRAREVNLSLIGLIVSS